jgi:hypothetical protein
MQPTKQEQPMNLALQSMNPYSLLLPEATINSLPMPSGHDRRGRHVPSIVTRPQVSKILPLLRDDQDREAVIRMFSWWDSLDAKLQMIHTAEGGGCDFFEIGLDHNGVHVIVSIYRMDEDAIYLRIDPDCDLVIREVPL